MYLYVYQNKKDMSNLSEIWVPCYQYENYFSVSNLGRVKVNSSGKILKTSICRKGYQNIRLYVKDISFKSHKVHRLILSSFVGGKEGYQVNHINGIKNDNNINNLEWVTASENMKHAYTHGLFKPNLPKSIYCSKSKLFLHKEYGFYTNLNEISAMSSISRNSKEIRKHINTYYITI